MFDLSVSTTTIPVSESLQHSFMSNHMRRISLTPLETQSLNQLLPYKQHRRHPKQSYIKFGGLNNRTPFAMSSSAGVCNTSAQSRAVPYQDGELRGLCLADYARLRLSQIPWNTLKSQPQNPYTVVESSNTRLVISFDFQNAAGISERVYAKRYRVRNFWKSLGLLFVSSKAKREWKLGHQLLAASVPTAVPLIYAERRAGGLLKEHYLVTRHLADTTSLHDVLHEIKSAQEKRDLLSALAAFLGSLHGRGFYHDDCSSRHILVSRSAGGDTEFRFFVIDLDGCSFGRRISARQRRKNFFQLFRSLRFQTLSKKDRVRFLRLYFGSGITERALRRLLWRINRIAKRKGEPKCF